ncbi:MAG: tRNA pseudouridine(55) synthase TruB [Mariprofundaceae bacterium]
MDSGVVFLDKPYGWTSRRAVNEIIRIFTEPGKKRIKAGHTGTLDPLATGMLPILIGEGTRFASLGLNAEKIYQVTFDLSYQTNTLDAEGEVTARFDRDVEESEVQQVIESFLGKQEQVPPTFSAIRIDGKRAHELARKGEKVEMQAREVTVLAIKLLAFSFPNITLEVQCSKGTYIRSLARDIGAKLGMGGCVTMLRRLSTGGWPEAMMVTAEDVTARAQTCILPLTMWLRDTPILQLDDEHGRRFLQGQRLQLSETMKGLVTVFNQDTLLGTGMMKEGMYRMVLHPEKILPSAQRSLL